ncbi:MAG: hypothetical protein NC834_01650, partial [Candidatus Omnitrophica bacterium]|nr:hypothetical protein [Candidatus Omnitrophota bacterium]
ARYYLPPILNDIENQRITQIPEECSQGENRTSCLPMFFEQQPGYKRIFIPVDNVKAINYLTRLREKLPPSETGLLSEIIQEINTNSDVKITFIIFGIASQLDVGFRIDKTPQEMEVALFRYKVDYDTNSRIMEEAISISHLQDHKQRAERLDTFITNEILPLYPYSHWVDKGFYLNPTVPKEREMIDDEVEKVYTYLVNNGLKDGADSLYKGIKKRLDDGHKVTFTKSYRKGSLADSILSIHGKVPGRYGIADTHAIFNVYEDDELSGTNVYKFLLEAEKDYHWENAQVYTQGKGPAYTPNYSSPRDFFAAYGIENPTELIDIDGNPV